jgi:hypothetical protein
MRAPFMKLTIGDYLYRMPGFAESVNISIADSSPWEIEEKYQLPHYIDVSMAYRPILNRLPQRSRHATNLSYFMAEPTIHKKSTATPGTAF